MKIWLWLALFLCCCTGAAAEEEAVRIAEGLDFSAWQEYADVQNIKIDVKDMVLSLVGLGEWDAEAIAARLKVEAKEKAEEAAHFAAMLAVPVLLCAVIGQVSPQKENMLEWFGVMITSAFLLAEFGDIYATAKEVLVSVCRLTETAFPLLMVLLTASGGTGTASVLAPAAATAGSMITRVGSEFGLGMCCCAAGIAAAGEISARLQLNKLFDFLKNICSKAMLLMMSLFLGVLKMQEMLGGAYDSAAIKTARYAADNLIPVVGGEVAGTVDMLAGSVRLVKGAAGITGIAMLALLCIGPVLKIAVPLFSCRILSAMLEPISNGRLVRLIERFADVMSMLLAVVTASMVLGMLLLGATLASGNGVA